MEPHYGELEQTFPDYKTPDQIEIDTVMRVKDWYDSVLASQVALEAIREFRRELSKNGYVFYQP